MRRGVLGFNKKSRKCVQLCMRAHPPLASVQLLHGPLLAHGDRVLAPQRIGRGMPLLSRRLRWRMFCGVLGMPAESAALGLPIGLPLPSDSALACEDTPLPPPDGALAPRMPEICSDFGAACGIDGCPPATALPCAPVLSMILTSAGLAVRSAACFARFVGVPPSLATDSCLSCVAVVTCSAAACALCSAWVCLRLCCRTAASALNC